MAFHMYDLYLKIEKNKKFSVIIPLRCSVQSFHYRFLVGRDHSSVSCFTVSNTTGDF